MQINEHTIDFIADHINDNVEELALTFKAEKNVDFKFAIQQISSRQKAKSKLPSWFAGKYIVFPNQISLEQCTSEAVAMYKSGLCSGKTFADITGGFGVDFLFMSRRFKRPFYVEINANLAQIVKHNLNIFGSKNFEIIVGNGIDFINKSDVFDCVYIDPARRDKNNKKQILLETCQPNILEIKNIIYKKAKIIFIKLSPLFDISEVVRNLDNIKKIHVISVQNECKELLVEIDTDFYENNIEICTINITKQGNQIFNFEYWKEKSIGYDFSPLPLKYLYEPNSSVQKSGGFKSFARRFCLKSINSNSKIFTADNLIDNFCGRVFLVEDVIPFKKQEIKKRFHDTISANVTVRNFPLSVADLRKKLNILEGGDLYIFATTVFDGSRVLIVCRKDI